MSINIFTFILRFIFSILLSPLLFSVYAEMVTLEALEDVEEGVRAGESY